MTPPIAGILNLDKPAGLSSARAVSRVKRLLPKGTKIGHAGTLDPFATGVLLLLIGKATKQCERLMDSPKQYDAVVRFGATTATDDPESALEPYVPKALRAPVEPDPPMEPLAASQTNPTAATDDPSTNPSKAESLAPPLVPPTREQLVEALRTFIGEIHQKPPTFSALKVGGRRAYDLARKGQTVELASRPVKVYGIELLSYDWPLATLRIDCGRGTYIRSIARDLGEALDVGGHLAALRRTAVGDFRVEDAATLETLSAETVTMILRPVTP